VHGWVSHAWYFKYHQDVQIVIIRVRCLGCRRTHAIIPSFSIPHTSLDTQTVQCYLEHRDAGLSRQKSAIASGFDGYGLDFLRGLEKRFSTAVCRAKALYPDWGNEHLNGVTWLANATADQAPALAVLNERRIKQTGQSFFGGNLAEPGRQDSLSKVASHKKATTVNIGAVLDST
jgi:hypothetical protein